MNSTYLTAFQKAFKIGSMIGILVLAYFFHTNADMCRVSHRELMSVWRHDCIRADRLSQCRSALVKPLTSFHRGAQSDQNVTFASVCVEGADSWSDTCIVNLDFKVLVVVHHVLFSAFLLSLPSRWLMGNWPPSSPRWSSSPAPMFSAAVCVERKASSVSSAKTDRSSTPSRRAQPRGTDHQITVLNIYLTKEIWAGHVILIYKKENRQKTGTLHWWLPDKHYKAEQALQYVDKKTYLSPFGARLDSVPWNVSLFMISCCWYMNITLSGRGFHLPFKGANWTDIHHAWVWQVDIPTYQLWMFTWQSSVLSQSNTLRRFLTFWTRADYLPKIELPGLNLFEHVSFRCFCLLFTLLQF